MHSAESSQQNSETSKSRVLIRCEVPVTANCRPDLALYAPNIRRLEGTPLRLFFVTALVLVMYGDVFGLAAQAGDTVAAILASPSSYDGKHVDVDGTAQDIQEKTSKSGNAYDTFSVCDGSCLHVFIFGRPHIVEGKKITVHGKFVAVKHVGEYTFHNEIDADEGSLP